MYMYVDAYVYLYLYAHTHYTLLHLFIYTPTHVYKCLCRAPSVHTHARYATFNIIKNTLNTRHISNMYPELCL